MLDSLRLQALFSWNNHLLAIDIGISLPLFPCHLGALQKNNRTQVNLGIEQRRDWDADIPYYIDIS